jgi:hypothetical protein
MVNQADAIRHIEFQEKIFQLYMSFHISDPTQHTKGDKARVMTSLTQAKERHSKNPE